MPFRKIEVLGQMKAENADLIKDSSVSTLGPTSSERMPRRVERSEINGGIFDSEGCCFFQSGPSSRAHGGRFSDVGEISTFLRVVRTVKDIDVKF